MIYHQDKYGTIYNANCLEVIKGMEDESVDLVLTDPPYPDYYKEEYKYFDGILNPLKKFSCKQLIFWSAKVDFPLDYTGIHIWDKRSNWGMAYERIFSRNADKNFRLYSYVSLKNKLVAQWAKDIFTKHPSQKPIRLIEKLIMENSKEGDTILDPFLGSGTTALACQNLKRKYIGIEISKEYCSIAVDRLRQKPLL